MIIADSATHLLKAPVIWFQGARLYLQTDTIPSDTTKDAPTYTGLSAKVKTPLLKRSGSILHSYRRDITSFCDIRQGDSSRKVHQEWRVEFGVRDRKAR